MPDQQSSWRWPYVTWKLGRSSLCPTGRRNIPQVEIHWGALLRLKHWAGHWNLSNFYCFFLIDLQTGVPVSVSACGGPVRIPVSRPVEQPKPVSKEPVSEWKMPALVNRHVSPEVWWHSLSATIFCAVHLERMFKMFHKEVLKDCWISILVNCCVECMLLAEY